MFYSTQILARKGPLGLVWIAAHMDRGLKRSQVYEASIPGTVDVLLSPEAPLALRLSGQLLLGVCRIYSHKVTFLFQDCQNALVKIRLARPEQLAALTKAVAGAKGRRRGGGGAAGADAPVHTLPLESITLPDDLDELQLLAGDNFDLQPGPTLEAMLEELQQGGRPGGARRRRTSMGISLAVSRDTGVQEGCSLGLLFAPSTHFTGAGIGDSADVEMEVFEDAGAPFQFDLEEVEIERLRAAPATEASGGVADLAALLGGELSAGGRTRVGAAIAGGDEDTRSGSPSSGLTVASSRERESAGHSVDRRKSTATVATVAAGGRGALKTSEQRLGELLPDLGLDAGGGGLDLDLAMDLGVSDEQLEDDDAGGATTPVMTPGVSGTRQRIAASAGGAGTGGGAADAAVKSASRSGTAAAAAVARGFSFTAEDIRATMEAADRAAASMDPYDVPRDADVNVIGHEGMAPASSTRPADLQDNDVVQLGPDPEREQKEQRGATPPPVNRDNEGIDAMEVDVDDGGAAALPTGEAMHAARTISGAGPPHVGIGAMQRSVSRTMGDSETEAGMGVEEGNSQARDAADVHTLGPAPSASQGPAGGPPSWAGGQAAGSDGDLQAGGPMISAGAVTSGCSGGGGGGGSAATASVDGDAGATAPTDGEQAAVAVAAVPLPRMLTRRAAAAVAAAEASAAAVAAVTTEPAATAAAAEANAAEHQGASEDQQSSPPQARAPMGRRRGARVAAGRSMKLDQEGLTIPTAQLREWIQDRSEILDQTRLLRPPSSTAAEPRARHHHRHYQQQQTAKRRRVAADGAFVTLMYARAAPDTEGVMGSGHDLLNATEPVAVGSWHLLMQDPAAADPSVAGRHLARQRMSIGAAASLAPSIQALFRVAVGQMAPQYALQMGAAAAAGPMGRARAPSGAAGGAPSDAGGAAICPAPSWRTASAGLAGRGTPAAAPAPSANTIGAGGGGADTAGGTPSVQRHGASPAQGLVGGASADAAMPMQVFSAGTVGRSGGRVTMSGAFPGRSLSPRSDGDARRLECYEEVGQGVEEEARAATPVGRLGSTLGGAAAATSGGGASRQGSAGNEGPAGSGRQLRVMLFPAMEGEDGAAQMMEDVHEEHHEHENEGAILADDPEPEQARAAAAATAAAATNEVSIGHTESDKENYPVDLNDDAGKEDLPPRQGALGTHTHRQPLAPQQHHLQYLSTPSRATGGMAAAASAGRMQGPGGRASAAFGAAASGASAAAAEGARDQRQGDAMGLDRAYGGGTVADAMDVDDEGRNAALGAEQGLAGGMDLGPDFGAADLAHGQVRSGGSLGTSAASAPSAHQAADGSGAANAGNPDAQGQLPQLATPLGSRQQVPDSAMRLRSQARSQPSALQSGQQYDAVGPSAGTPLGVGAGVGGDDSMSHSEGLGLGSMLQRRQRSRFIDDDGVDSGGGEAAAGGSGGGYSGYSGDALSAGRNASQQGTGSQGRLCRSNLHSIQEEVEEQGTPVQSAAAGPGPGTAQLGSNGHLASIDPRTTGALRTALASGSGLRSDVDWSREHDESLATRTLQEFDLVARAAAVAAVAAAGIGGTQPGSVAEAAGTSQQPDSEGRVSEMLPLGLDLLRRPFGCTSSQQSQRQLSQPVARKLYERDAAGKGAEAAAVAGTQHPTQLRSDGESDGVDMGTHQRAHQPPSTQEAGGDIPGTQWRPTSADLSGSQGMMPPWGQALLFRGRIGGGAGGSQATGCAAGAARLSEMTRDRRRKDAARCFYDILVLNNRGLVDLQHEAPTRASRHATGAPAGAAGGPEAGLTLETEAGAAADDDGAIPDVWVTLTQAGVEAASQRLLQRPASQ